MLWGEAAPQRMGTEVWPVSLYHVVYFREETPGLVFISETKQADQSHFLFTTQCAYKKSLVSHTLCVATQVIQRQMLQGKQTAPSGSL